MRRAATGDPSMTTSVEDSTCSPRAAGDIGSGVLAGGTAAASARRVRTTTTTGPVGSARSPKVRSTLSMRPFYPEDPVSATGARWDDGSPSTGKLSV